MAWTISFPGPVEHFRDDRGGPIVVRMMTVRKATERGHANHGWLDSHHTFSFANYHDPKHMGFRALRVINDDRIEGGAGFGSHPHQDMEIISYVLDGAIAHKDSMGTGAVIKPGDVQRMSAGTGVVHSEFNASKTDEAHFLQIWIQPDKVGIKPSYAQREFTDADKRGQLRLVASPDGQDGSLTINADARVYATILGAGQTAELALAAGRYAWIHVAQGTLKVDGQELGAGDGAAISKASVVKLEGVADGEALVFDLA